MKAKLRDGIYDVEFDREAFGMIGFRPVGAKWSCWFDPEDPYGDRCSPGNSVVILDGDDELKTEIALRMMR